MVHSFSILLQWFSESMATAKKPTISVHVEFEMYEERWLHSAHFCCEHFGMEHEYASRVTLVTWNQEEAVDFSIPPSTFTGLPSTLSPSCDRKPAAGEAISCTVDPADTPPPANLLMNATQFSGAAVDQATQLTKSVYIPPHQGRPLALASSILICMHTAGNQAALAPPIAVLRSEHLEYFDALAAEHKTTGKQ